MKHHLPILIAALWALLGLSIAAAQQTSPKPAPLPPLKVDKSAPLLLDEPPAATSSTQKASAGKPALPKLVCYDCHGNYKEEPLAVTHAAKGITCVTCHGASAAHSGDEANVTPPQIMYTREAVASRCRMCHTSHDVAPEKVVARWQERGLQKTDPKKLVCTDCHGNHRLKIRTVRWDKRTRQVLPPEKKGK